MPQSATDILLAKGNLTPEQIAYLEKYTVTVGASAPCGRTSCGINSCSGRIIIRNQ